MVERRSEPFAGAPAGWEPADQLLVAAWRPKWWDDAACRGWPLEWWFPTTRLDWAAETTTRARKICADCPVRNDCLEAAIKERPSAGIWAGFTYTHIRKLARYPNLNRNLTNEPQIMNHPPPNSRHNHPHDD